MRRPRRAQAFVHDCRSEGGDSARSLSFRRYALRVPPQLPPRVREPLQREWLRKLRRVAGHVQTDEFASEESY